MRNKLFQLAWRFLKPHRGNSLGEDFAWMVRQFQIADWFGGAQLVIFGDSNGASLQPFERAKRFKPITVNISRGGTTFFEWELFFVGSPQGAAIRQRIGTIPVLVNCGGNHALQNRMTDWEKAARSIRRLFPFSWIMNVPPVLPEVLRMVSEEAPANVLALNRGISKIWADQVIDVYAMLHGNSTAYTMLTSDTIHYSEAADRARIDAINAVYGGRW